MRKLRNQLVQNSYITLWVGLDFVKNE